MKIHFLCEMRMYTLTIGHAQSDGATELLLLFVLLILLASIFFAPIMAFRGYRRKKLWLRVVAMLFALIHLGFSFFLIFDVFWAQSLLMLSALISIYFTFKKSPIVQSNA